MKAIWSIGVLVLAVSVALGAAQAPKKGSLYGWAVVIDPGHGGIDPGASGTFSGKRVVEDEYVYDVALRVSRLVRSRQGLPFMTIRGNSSERNQPPNQVLPDERTERFTLDGIIVRAGTTGLLKRLAYGNSISRRYPRHHQAWLSIHFDVIGRNRDIEGVRIIAPDIDLRIAKALEKSFGQAKRLRTDNPVVANGDRDFGLRRLFVLTSRNHIRERALIELGNFNNEAEVWRIRSPQIRDAYARAIVRALENW